MLRDSKKERGANLSDDEIANLPKYLSKPDIILFNKEDKKLNLLYISKDKNSNKYNKIVIDPKGYIKKQGAETIVKTSGKVEKFNLLDKKYEVIEGKL